MRSQKQLESAIDEIKRRISTAQELRSIATFSGAEQLLSLLNKTREFYEKSIATLDESNPALNRDYAKCKACLTLVNGFITGITNAEHEIESLKVTFLELNEELGFVMDEKKRREKNAM